MALYVNGEERVDGYDYEFFEGEVVDITELVYNDDDGDFDFYVNGEVGCCPVEDFTWVKLDTSEAVFEFRDGLPDKYAYDAVAVLTGDCTTYEPYYLIQLEDIYYDAGEDMLYGILRGTDDENDGKEVRIPRTSLSFVGY